VNEPRALERVNGARGVERMRMQERNDEIDAKEGSVKLRRWRTMLLARGRIADLVVGKIVWIADKNANFQILGIVKALL